MNVDELTIFVYIVMRQKTAMEPVASAHYFRGIFKDGSMTVYNISPEFANECKGEVHNRNKILFTSSFKYLIYYQDFNLKEHKFGIIYNNDGRHKQLAMGVFEYK